MAKTGKQVIVPDVRQDSRYVNARVETRSEMVVPITSSDRVIGVTFSCLDNGPALLPRARVVSLKTSTTWKP